MVLAYTTTTKYDKFFIAILIYITLDYGRPFDFLPFLGVLRLPFFLSFFLFFSWLSSPLKKRSPQLICLILFVLAMAKNVPFATNNYWAFWTTIDMGRLVFFVCLPIMTFVNNLSKIDTYVKVWVVAHIFLATYGLLNKGVGLGAHLQDENDFALAINMAIPFAYFLFLESSKKAQKIFYLSAGILFIFATIASLSRGGFIGLAAVLGYCWWKTPGKLKATVITGILIMSMLMFAGDEYWNEMASIQNDKDETAQERTYSWGKAWEMFLDHPIFGVGPGNFPWNFEKYESSDSADGGRLHGGRVAHSLYFTLLPELAIPGVLLFCALLYYNRRDKRYILRLSKILLSDKKPSKFLSDDLQKELKKYRFITLALNGSLIGYLVSGAFVAVLYYPHFWLITAFTTTLKSTVDMKNDEWEKAWEAEKKQEKAKIARNDSKTLQRKLIKYGESVLNVRHLR